MMLGLDKLLNEDDRAVSPVIGVILMVAITVILAAVIATFVLGLGESVNKTAPTMSFDCEGSTAVVQGGQTSFEGTVTDAGETSYSSLTAGDRLDGNGNIVWKSDDGTQSAVIFKGCN